MSSDRAPQRAQILTAGPSHSHAIYEEWGDRSRQFYASMWA
ncbi:MAG: hypothetical protein ACFB12_17105 [Leptolyngbyaceae cyanobacterium]